MGDSTRPDRLTVYADYVCPFCYLGRQSLERYRERRTEPLAIDWQPFDLRRGKRGPDGEIREDEWSDEARIGGYGGDDGYYDRARRNVRELRDAYGVEMAQDLATDVDSLNAQLVSFHAKFERPDRWPALDEAIYDALWREGRDVGDPAVLADLGEAVGIPADEVRAAIGDEELRERLEDRFDGALRHDVTGVPTFIYDDERVFGAVSPDRFRELLEE